MPIPTPTPIGSAQLLIDVEGLLHYEPIGD
jgi:hypothetical protein